MVGVPGRSKGCHVCRKRKIACGLEKPQCAQCIKSKRICTGYQRDRIFINHSAGEREAAAPAVAVVMAPGPAVKATGGCITVGQMNHMQHSLSLASNREVYRPMFQEVSPFAQHRQQLIGAFLSYHVPEKKREAIEEKSWFTLLSQLPSPILALDSSMLAICTARLGRIHNDQALVQTSLRLYTEGLRELQKALYDPVLMYNDETLGACMGLATYEIMECPAGTKYAYASHRSGCAKLIQLRGVGAHTSGLGHQMFVSFRLQTIMDALEYHQPTYLSDKTWLTLPWKHNPKTRFDELLDIVSEAPAIFRRADDFESLDPQQKLNAACAVIEDCWKVDGTLQKFLKELETASLGPLYWPEPSKKSAIQDAEEFTSFPAAYRFPDVQTGKTMVLYWAVLTMLWTGMTRLYYLVMALRQAGVSTPDSYELPPLEHRAEFITQVRNLLQSVEYMMQDKTLGLGPQSIVAPLSITVETIRDFPQYAREVTWAEEVLDEIRGRGLQILGCLNRS